MIVSEVEFHRVRNSDVFTIAIFAGYDVSVGEQFRCPPGMVHPSRPGTVNFHQSGPVLQGSDLPPPLGSRPPIQTNFSQQYSRDQTPPVLSRLHHPPTAEGGGVGLNGVDTTVTNYVKVQKPHNDGVVFMKQANLGGRLLPSEAVPPQQRREAFPYRAPIEALPVKETPTRKVENQTPGPETPPVKVKQSPPMKRKFHTLDRLVWVKSKEELDPVHHSLGGRIRKKHWNWIPNSPPE